MQGQESVQLWGNQTGNLWRTTDDICGPGHATWQGELNFICLFVPVSLVLSVCLSFVMDLIGV